MHDDMLAVSPIIVNEHTAELRMPNGTNTAHKYARPVFHRDCVHVAVVLHLWWRRGWWVPLWEVFLCRGDVCRRGSAPLDPGFPISTRGEASRPSLLCDLRDTTSIRLSISCVGSGQIGQDPLSDTMKVHRMTNIDPIRSTHDLGLCAAMAWPEDHSIRLEWRLKKEPF